MDYPQIKSILEKYWNGDSSVEEEKMLRQYFSQSNIPDELKVYQPLFQHFEAAQSTKLSPDFDDKLVKALDEKGGAKVKRLVLPQWFRVAAMILVCFGMYHFMINSNPIESKSIVWEDTYEDPEEAYLETIMALKLVSKKLNKGKKETTKGLIKMKKSTRSVTY